MFRRFAICVVITAIAIACSSKKSTESMPAEFFPQTVGTRWTYWAYDSLGTAADTVDVEIVESRVDSRGAGNIWSVAGRKGEWIPDGLRLRQGESLVIVRGDSVLFFYEEPSPTPYMILLLPLEEENGWRTDFGTWPDTTTVGGLQATTTPAGEFPNARLLKQAIGYLDCFWFYDKLFVPEIGFVKGRKESSAHLCGSDFLYIWELVSYEVP